MSLRIRRGTDSQRQAITFDLGEIVYTTDSKKLFVGDGVTVGGVNVVKTAAGSGLSWNNSTQQLDINGENLSTSNIVEGTNLYFTTDRAQDATGSLFTHDGHSNISFTYDDSTNKIFATVTVPGINGQALTTSNIPEGTNLYFTSERAQDASAGLFTHNNHTNISFTYDDDNNKVIATVTNGSGILSVSADTNPALGGNLTLNSHNITGVGNINITGDITSTNINGKLGSNLDINSQNIVGTGDINITGSITATTINAKLGSDLNLNSHNITGVGNININGDINSHSFSTGPISISDNYISMSNNSSLHIRSHVTRQFSVVDGSLLNMGSMDIAACKNSITSPVSLSADDYIGTFAFSAYYNDSFNIVGALTAQLDSIPTLTPFGVSGNMYISVNSENIVGNRAIYKFSSSGKFSAPIIQPGVYSNAVERDSVIINPEPGMIVYLTDISKFTGYVDNAGSNVPGWVNLN